MHPSFPAKTAQHIRLLALDVDGVLTNSELLFNQDGDFAKAFHVNDGFGLRLLIKSGIDVAIITGKQSDIVRHRMGDLGIQHIYQNQAHKMLAYEDLKHKCALTDQHIAYMGDDLPDLKVMKTAGLGIAVANADPSLHEHADWITTKMGGHGAVREVCQAILQAQGKWDAIVETYLTHGTWINAL